MQANAGTAARADDRLAVGTADGGGPSLLGRGECAKSRDPSVLYARVAPGMPYTIVNYAAGLTAIRLGVFAGATAIGAAPRAFAYTALGGSLGDLRSPEAIVALAVLVVMALVGAVALRRDVRG